MDNAWKNPLMDIGNGSESRDGESVRDANDLWTVDLTPGSRKQAKSPWQLTNGANSEGFDGPADGLYARIKQSRLTGPLAEGFTRAIESNQAPGGEPGYGMHNLSDGFVSRLMYPHSTPLGNEAARKLFQDSPSAYAYLTGKKSPPKRWGTYVGAQYDEEAGRRAEAEGRDLGALESQLRTMEYRPERDGSGNDPYRTMEYRPERDGYGNTGDEMMRVSASDTTLEGGGNSDGLGESGGSGESLGQDWDSLKNQWETQETLNKAQDMIEDLSDPQLSEGNTSGGAAGSSSSNKLMDYFPNPMSSQEDPATGDTGEAEQKIQGRWNQQDALEAGGYKPLMKGVQDIGEKVDRRFELNEMQDRLDEKKVVWVGGKAYPWNEVYKGVDEVPNGNNVWEYNNKTGVLSKNGKSVYRYGYSGKGRGLNNPDMVGVRNIGPTPNGIYEIVNREDRDNLGDSWALDETNPAFIKKIGRDPGTFYIHGDNKSGNRSASEGCIVIPRDIRDLMNDGDVITVITK